MARVVHLLLGAAAACIALFAYPWLPRLSDLPADGRTAQLQLAHVVFLLTAGVLTWPREPRPDLAVPEWAALVVVSTMVLLWCLPFGGYMPPPQAGFWSMGAGLAAAVFFRRAP